MAKVQNPITGRSSGRFAKAVFRTVHEKNVMQAAPESGSRSESISQVSERSKFQTVVAWVSLFLQVIRIGFSSLSSKQSAYNAAVSWYLQYAVHLVLEKWTINYSAAMFSFGELLGSDNFEVFNYAYNAFQVNFDNNSGTGNASANDLVTIIAYNPARGEKALFLDHTTRDQGTFIVEFLPEWAEYEIHVWIYFMSADGSLISDSQYVGPASLLTP